MAVLVDAISRPQNATPSAHAAWMSVAKLEHRGARWLIDIASRFRPARRFHCHHDHNIDLPRQRVNWAEKHPFKAPFSSLRCGSRIKLRPWHDSGVMTTAFKEI